MTEELLEHTEQRLDAHEVSECRGQPCPLHNRTDHLMREFPQHWRDDRGLMERICPHGIGHPDPDQWAFLVKRFGKKYAAGAFVHGCDGCCRVTTVAESAHDDTERART